MGVKFLDKGFLFVVSVFILFSFTPYFNVSGDGTGDYPSPETGDWIVTNNTKVSNEIIHLNGSLKVRDNSTLVLDNVTLLFNSTDNGRNGIIIDSGSSAFISGSVVTATSGFIIFRVQGNLTLEDSSVNRTTGGIYIEYGDVLINNCTIFNNRDIAISGSGHPKITNNTIYSSSTGISLSSGSAPFIYNNHIFSNEMGINCIVFSYATILNNNISGNTMDGIRIELGEVNIHNNIISNNGEFGIWGDRAKLNATNNSIFGNNRWGIRSFQAPLNSENNHFERHAMLNGQGDVIQEWDIIVHVFDSENNTLDNVNLTIFNKGGGLVKSADTIGNVKKFTLREFESENNESLVIHNPFTIVANKSSFTNSSTLNIIGSEMSPIYQNTHYVYIEIEEEEEENPPCRYGMPLWGLIIVVGIWLFVAILLIIGIIRVSRDRRRRKG
jgi:parallel beta-helix repeat protein